MTSKQPDAHSPSPSSIRTQRGEKRAPPQSGVAGLIFGLECRRHRGGAGGGGGIGWCWQRAPRPSPRLTNGPCGGGPRLARDASCYCLHPCTSVSTDGEDPLDADISAISVPHLAPFDQQSEYRLALQLPTLPRSGRLQGSQVYMSANALSLLEDQLPDLLKVPWGIAQPGKCLIFAWHRPRTLLSVGDSLMPSNALSMLWYLPPSIRADR